MPPPNCKKQVQSFIDMVNYLSKFSAYLSELSEPIREMSKEKVPFNWGPEHQESFKLVKKEIATAPIQSQEGNNFTDRCRYQGSWSLLATRRKTCIFHKQGTDGNTKRLCDNRARSFGIGLDDGEIPSLSLCQPLHSGGRPETTVKNSI